MSFRQLGSVVRGGLLSSSAPCAPLSLTAFRTLRTPIASVSASTAAGTTVRFYMHNGGGSGSNGDARRDGGDYRRGGGGGGGGGRGAVGSREGGSFERRGRDERTNNGSYTSSSPHHRSQSHGDGAGRGGDYRTTRRHNSNGRDDLNGTHNSSSRNNYGERRHSSHSSSYSSQNSFRGSSQQRQDTSGRGSERPRPSSSPDELRGGGGGGGRSEPAATTAAAPNAAEAVQRLPRGVPGMGWSYDAVDANGKTAMDRLYESEYEKITHVLSGVIDSLSTSNGGATDGSLAPDFAIGLQYYNHTMRLSYQTMIAKCLGLHHSQVRLSTAWNARYDVSQFPKNVQMVLGVTLVGGRPSGNGGTSSGSGSLMDDDAEEELGSEKGKGKGKGDEPRRLLNPPQAFVRSGIAASAAPLYAEGSLEEQRLRAGISTLVREISGLVRPEFVAAQIVKATTKVSEVEYATAEAEAKRRAVWNKFGVPQYLFIEVRILLHEFTKVYSAVIIHDLAPEGFVRPAAAALSEEGKVSLAQRLDVDRDLVLPIGGGTPVSFVNVVLPLWEKQFAATELVPLVLNSWEFVEALGDAGMNVPKEVAAVHAQIIDTEGHYSDDARAAAARTLSSAVSAATYDIISRMASVARVEEMGAMQLSKDGGGRTNRFGTPRVLPAVFVHGVFVGGIAEMTYLRSNKEAFIALAANPQDIRVHTKGLAMSMMKGEAAVVGDLTAMSHVAQQPF